MSYLEFTEYQLPVMKTKAANVSNKGRGFHLGVIKWYGPWRQHCFFPAKDVTFNKECLREIANQCEQMTKEHKRPK